jgi:hypothetical protein
MASFHGSPSSAKGHASGGVQLIPVWYHRGAGAIFVTEGLDWVKHERCATMVLAHESVK